MYFVLIVIHFGNKILTVQSVEFIKSSWTLI